MAFRVRLPDRKLMAGKKLGWGALLLRGLLVGAAAVMLVVLAVFGYYYYRYTGIVDERLKQPLFATTAKIYAAPREVRPGQKLTISAIVNELRSRLHGRWRLEGLSARHILDKRRDSLHQARSAKLPLAGWGNDSVRRWRSACDFRRSRAGAGKLRTGAAAHHRLERRRQSRQAPRGHLRPAPAQSRPGRCSHRRPPLLRA